MNIGSYAVNLEQRTGFNGAVSGCLSYSRDTVYRSRHMSTKKDRGTVTEGTGRNRSWPCRCSIPELPCGDLRRLRNSTINIAGVPAENRTQYLPNAVLERCRCTNLLVVYEISMAVLSF
jgi:hypothetical protein